MAYILAKKQSPQTAIYGAKWLGTFDPAWIRTDAASLFTDPNPYYAGMSTTPSSPFDTISPWKDMKRVEDSAAGTLVEIPKFYYKWSRPTGYSDGLALQISMHQYDGFLCSPAHADRGDGKGERDVVYVGRYKCASDYKNKTGITPKANETRATFRSGIHNLGSTIWQNDFAMLWTIRMLYLVEFAHWNSQAKIGYGCGNNSSFGNTGYTDNMPYHTGTTQSSRTTYGSGTQYRYIEGLWDNYYEWCDGIYCGGSNNANIYGISNPANFSDNAGGTLLGTRLTSNGYITAWSIPSTSGFEYALFPSAVNGSDSTYICDEYKYDAGGTLFLVGAYYGNYQNFGLFRIAGDVGTNSKTIYISSRLMKLP